MQRRGNNRPNWVLISAIALAVTLIVLVVINFQTQKKEQKELEAKKLAETLEEIESRSLILNITGDEAVQRTEGIFVAGIEKETPSAGTAQAQPTAQPAQEKEYFIQADAGAGEFTIRDSSGNKIAKMNASGVLALKGKCVYHEKCMQDFGNTALTNRPCGSGTGCLIIRQSNGSVVAYFNESGSLCLKHKTQIAKIGANNAYDAGECDAAAESCPCVAEDPGGEDVANADPMDCSGGAVSSTKNYMFNVTGKTGAGARSVTINNTGSLCTMGKILHCCTDVDDGATCSTPKPPSTC